MTALLTYTIDGKPYAMDVSGSPDFVYGEHLFLSTADTDIAFGADWYDDGYKIIPFLDSGGFAALKAEISAVIENIVRSIGIDTQGFEIENYHRFVTRDEDHFAVVTRTRDLFPEDFSLSMRDLIYEIERLTGFRLTDFNAVTGERFHIIVRINRPGSTDYNPPHKDSHEDLRYDFLNIWVPICGVTSESSLPIVPGSHLLPEDKILRTMEGGVVAGKKYRVRAIASWDGRSDLYRAKVEDGQLLMFSCHLIHGMGFNNQDDRTRVALEFRLFNDRTI